MFARVGVVLVSLLRGSAVREQRRQVVAGNVSHVYTFGAPHPSNPALTTRDGGCFDGYRFTNFDKNGLLREEDIVPTLLTLSSYNHPSVKTIALQENRDDGIRYAWDCGKNPYRITQTRVALHDGGLYQSNMMKLPDEYSRAKEASAVGLKNSYIKDLNTVRSNLLGTGWTLVGTALWDKDISHLMQETSSKRCILTFEGTDNADDFIQDIKIIRTTFCGLRAKVHSGFKDELMGMVTSDSYIEGIRTKLGKCQEVDAVGHSLGGAVAAIFTACLSSQNGSDDYNLMSWNIEEPQLMVPL